MAGRKDLEDDVIAATNIFISAKSAPPEGAESHAGRGKAEAKESPAEAENAREGANTEPAEAVPESLKDIADLKGIKPERKNAKHKLDTVVVSHTRTVTYGAPRDIKEKEEAQRTREALREKEARRVARTVYIDGEEPKTRRLQSVLQESLYDALRAAAAEDGVSVNEYVCQALREKILNSRED